MKSLNGFFGAVASVFLAFASGEVLATETVEPVTPTGRIDLFNGKDFSGWTFCMTSNSEPSKTWSATNGIIHCTGRPHGYARTAQSYRDYRLTVEWRFVKVTPRADNSGIFVHVQPPDKVWPKGIECQGQNQHQGDLILLNGAAFKGYEPPAIYRIVPSPEPPHEKPAGEWNTYEILAAGDHLKVYVNGKLMNEASECSLSSGSIAIQSEGGEIEVRKIYLEPVKTP
jgi:hypothetical protein